MRVVEPLLKQLSERDLGPCRLRWTEATTTRPSPGSLIGASFRFALQAPCDRYLTVCRRRAVAFPLSRPTPRIGQSQPASQHR